MTEVNTKDLDSFVIGEAPPVGGKCVSIMTLVVSTMTCIVAVIACAFVADNNRLLYDELVNDIKIALPVTKEMGGAFLGGSNTCEGKKPKTGFENSECVVDGVVAALEQAGANVTKGFVGGLETEAEPITTPYYQAGLCPVNVHWHLGAEHLSVGEYDENGHGPADSHRKLQAGEVRLGLQCHHYDATDTKFTTEYEWKHCVDMHVGQTYEVHWPHSAAGACGTVNQYQTPFYDGVFCVDGVLTSTNKQIGVQSQVYTIVNDETYYYPDMIKGMIVEGDYGKDIAKYTGSTTGTSRSNQICSAYTPITWQVDRKCHLISASSFDKMCEDMKMQRDDMSGDLYAHGSREIVAKQLSANNLQK